MPKVTGYGLGLTVLQDAYVLLAITGMSLWRWLIAAGF
jgi:hypothetical protein